MVGVFLVVTFLMKSDNENAVPTIVVDSEKVDSIIKEESNVDPIEKEDDNESVVENKSEKAEEKPKKKAKAAAISSGKLIRNLVRRFSTISGAM